MDLTISMWLLAMLSVIMIGMVFLYYKLIQTTFANMGLA